MGVGVADAVQATAYLAAACRAAETARPFPRVSDEYARLFQPPSGTTQAAHRRLLDAGGDEVVARTALIDELLLAAVRDRPGCRILNLGAGFCARPYRLALASCAVVVELDAAPIIEAKQRVLTGHQPSCPVSRIPMDLRDHAALARFLSQRSPTDQSTVVVSEGLLPYLPPADIAALAATLATALGDALWLTDIISTGSAQGMATLATTAGAAIQLYGLENLDSFEANGWSCVDYRILPLPQRYGPTPGAATSSRQVVDGVIALRPRDA